MGEPLEVITRIEGVGNVPLIRQPEYTFPDGFEDYRPQESLNFNAQMGRVQGHKMFTNVLIARRAGEFMIPETSISYYDDRARRYVNKTLPAINITVLRDPNVVYSYVQDSQFNLTPLTGTVTWMASSAPVHRSKWWLWAGFIFPLLIGSSLLGYLTYRKRINDNPAIQRSRQAYSTAMQKLAEAEQAGSDFKMAYAAIFRAITGFISDKRQTASAGQPDTYYLEHLRQAGLEEDVIKQCKKLLDRCSTIRYAPNTTRTFLNKDIENTKALLQQLRKLL
ncbi:MAG: BatD family protein [Rhodothermaceae bacterium]|nr:BatD family protein [Rhodothermaceae bacterium]